MRSPLTAPLTGRPCVYYRIEYRCTADGKIDVIGAPTRVPEPDVPQIELGYRDALPTRLVFASGHRVVEKPRERRYIGAR